MYVMRLSTKQASHGREIGEGAFAFLSERQWAERHLVGKFISRQWYAAEPGTSARALKQFTGSSQDYVNTIILHLNSIFFGRAVEFPLAAVIIVSRDHAKIIVLNEVNAIEGLPALDSYYQGRLVDGCRRSDPRANPAACSSKNAETFEENGA